jgi:hypothetical protein
MSDKAQYELVKGQFTASEAMDIVQALFDQKINFHKLQRLSWYEGNVHANTEFPDGRISQLLRDKELAREFLMSHKAEGKKYRIIGNLEIERIDEE